MDEEIINLLKEVIRKVDENSTKVDIHFHCHTLQLNTDRLENLDLNFDFDEFEIKENSGTIGFGNNFGMENKELNKKEQKKLMNQIQIRKVKAKKLNQQIELKLKLIIK